MSRGEARRRRNWTAWLRGRLARTVPPGQWLPDRQPVYVQSWTYVFGVATLAALLFVFGSGLVLTLKGAAWWHTSSVGHFFNSMHLWSVELFFACMVIHLWGKFFMAAWRGKRALTWITGAVAFVGSIGTAFTGYLTQSNFDSQWISTQAKDGLNAVGIGAYFNVLDSGPDVVVARRAAAVGRRCARRAARDPGPPARCGAAVRRSATRGLQHGLPAPRRGP